MDSESTLPARIDRFEKFRFQTLRQIEKDFALSGFRLELEATLTNYEAVVNRLSRWMEDREMLRHSNLPTLLYHLDLKINDGTLHESPPYHALAQRILLKCAEKVHRRNHSV